MIMINKTWNGHVRLTWRARAWIQDLQSWSHCWDSLLNNRHDYLLIAGSIFFWKDQIAPDQRVGLHHWTAICSKHRSVAFYTCLLTTFGFYIFFTACFTQLIFVLFVKKKKKFALEDFSGILHFKMLEPYYFSKMFLSEYKFSLTDPTFQMSKYGRFNKKKKRYLWACSYFFSFH